MRALRFLILSTHIGLTLPSMSKLIDGLVSRN